MRGLEGRFLGVGLGDNRADADTSLVTRSPSFDEVVEAAKRGAAWAVEEIYRSMAPAVLGYARGQGAMEPEDVTSEVFEAVVRRLPAFHGDERSFRSWVFSIAHRRLMDERRRWARRKEEPVAPDAMAGGDAGNAEEEAMARLGSRWVAGTLEVLTPEQRSVLLLRVVADLSVEESAAILGKTSGAVKTLQRRALAALGRHLERESVS